MKSLNTTLLITAALALTACSQSKDPYGDTCKSIASALSGNKSIAWEDPERKVVDGEYLRINLFSPQTTASCFYKAQVQDAIVDVPLEGEFENTPYRMIVNGTQVADADLIKASVMAMSGDAKKAALETAQKARENAKTAVRKTQETAAAAQKKLQEALGK